MRPVDLLLESGLVVSAKIGDEKWKANGLSEILWLQNTVVYRGDRHKLDMSKR